jgi:hypothetical protein
MRLLRIDNEIFGFLRLLGFFRLLRMRGLMLIGFL